MNKIEMATITKNFVKDFLFGESSGHDYSHINRVKNMALKIGRIENADLFIVEMSALLHDIADRKLNNEDEEAGVKIVREWLERIGVQKNETEHIMEIVETLSYKGASVKTDMRTIEGKVVQDADRLDAIGAIGIARAFAYGGSRKRQMYDPEVKPQMHKTYEQYKNDRGTTINHFYEKLLLLKDRMNTETARKIANSRHEFMERYLKEFYKEWEGKD